MTEESTFEEYLTDWIKNLQSIENNQEAEVAAKFLCEARGLFRNGKDELGQRKVEAAKRVLWGGTNG